MFVVKITYTAPIEEIDKFLTAHRDFLEVHYQNGVFIASGPMTPRTGGIIVAFGDDQAALETILAEDPFKQAGVADYEFIHFNAVKHCKALSEFFA